MNFKFLLCLSVFLFCPFITFAEKSISYISDNIYMSDSFNTKYIDTIQKFADDDFGKDTIKINRVSNFDINTTQCLELFDALYSKKHQDALILMIGNSNYHNLYGFSSYMKSRDRNSSVIIRQPRNIYEINKEMLKIYSKFDNTKLTNIVSNVYKVVTGENFNKTFKPKIIPTFHVLNNNFMIDNNLLSVIESYNYTWNLIRNKKFDEAKQYLKNIIEKKPSQSLLYYALGSVYLEENKENAEFNALQCFENGILVDPFNKKNFCYKGLVVLYMLYKGEIVSEILFFVRALNKFITFTSDDMEAIMSINTVDYDKKIQFINDWIISDMDKLINKSRQTNTKLIFTSYPEELPVNSLISEHTKHSSSILYLENKADKKENLDSIIYNMAKKMYDFLKEIKLFQ